MGLRELKDDSLRVHVVAGKTGKGMLYCYDVLKGVSGSSSGSRYRCENAKEFNRVLENLYLSPLEGKNWFLTCTKGGTKGVLGHLKKEGVGVLENSYIMLETDNWGSYKQLEETLRGLKIRFNMVYLDYVRRDEITYLFEGELDQPVVQFLSRGYSRDAEKIYALREMGSWGSLTPQKIVGEVGYGSSSMPQMVLDMLKFEKFSGEKTPIRFMNRMKKVESLVKSTSPRYVWVAWVGVLKDFIYLKELYLTGKLYKKVPQGYERYSYLLEDILNVPLGAMVEMYGKLCKSQRGWYNGIDVVEFMYSVAVEGSQG